MTPPCTANCQDPSCRRDHGPWAEPEPMLPDLIVEYWMERSELFAAPITEKENSDDRKR